MKPKAAKTENTMKPSKNAAIQGMVAFKMEVKIKEMIKQAFEAGVSYGMEYEVTIKNDTSSEEDFETWFNTHFR